MEKRILIVEDEEKLRRVYREVLADQGFTILEAEDAGEAYGVLEREYIDLIILDIRMEEVDGATLNEVIRFFFRDKKVLVASVYPVEDQRILIPDAFDYFDKAQGIDLLVQKVKRFFYFMDRERADNSWFLSLS
jgi:DNA-binding NtrC family response regulator